MVQNLKPPGENYFMSSFYWYFQFILIESSTIILLTLIRMEKAFIELDTDFLAGKWQAERRDLGQMHNKSPLHWIHVTLSSN